MGTLPALAQTFPTGVVRIVNPFPGGPTDTFARIVARLLQKDWGQSVIVEGKAGAGGMIAVTSVAKAPPDGYTILVTSSSTQVVQPAIRRNVPYDAEKDFQPLFCTGAAPFIVVVNASLPIVNLAELIAYAKAHPGQLSFGSSGPGTGLHLAGEVFANAVGVKLLHVPYKTAAQASVDLLGGQIHMMFDSAVNSKPGIESGRLRAIAAMGTARSPVLPDTPTMAELGVPNATFDSYLGVYLPARTPKEIGERIIRILRAGSGDAELLEYLRLTGLRLDGMTYGGQFAQAERQQRVTLARLISHAKLPLLD
jgi:tripartite-type tricarboxylate transporter receptor subunit TctC